VGQKLAQIEKRNVASWRKGIDALIEDRTKIDLLKSRMALLKYEAEEINSEYQGVFSDELGGGYSLADTVLGISPLVSRSKMSGSKSMEIFDFSKIFSDGELLSRCSDLMNAESHFDRVVREATTILDDILKKLSGISDMMPSSLVSKVLNPISERALIVVSENAAEQEGFHYICKGVMLLFRDSTHHNLSDKFSREDAIKVCGLIDTLLKTIGEGKEKK
jgi:hypothetical protein